MSYQSKPGDARRQGRSAAPVQRAKREVVQFVDQGGRVFARLGVHTVGVIDNNPAGGSRHQFVFVCALASNRIQPAADLDAAKRAIKHNVEQWIEAAGLSAKGDHS
jgi:hypothetical protein